MRRCQVTCAPKSRAGRPPACPRRLGEAGAVAVEFALVVPILGMLLLGIVTFGLAYSDHVALTNAVREGARLGATADTPAPANPGDPDPWASSVVDQTATSYANTDNPLNPDDVCAVLYNAAGTATHWSSTACKGPNATAGPPPHPPSTPTSCYLMVWAALPTDLNWLLASTTVVQHADSVSIYQRADTC